MAKKYPYYYKRHGLKIVTAFLDPAEIQKLKHIAKDADKSLTRYVTRLLQTHINQQWTQKTEDLPKRFKP